MAIVTPWMQAITDAFRERVEAGAEYETVQDAASIIGESGPLGVPIPAEPEDFPHSARDVNREIGLLFPRVQELFAKTEGD